MLLDLSSGGGAVVPSMDLYLALQRLDRVTPVFVSIGSVAASGAYLATLGARRVYAYPDSTIGSIGVVYPHLAVKGLLDRLGIEVELLHQGRHKDAFQGYRALTEEERSKMLALAEETYREFIGLVAQRRHRSVGEIERIATGEVFSGRRSVELGLVDALGDRETALEELSRSTGVPAHRRVVIEPPRRFLERLIGAGGGAFGTGLAGAVSAALEERLLEQWFGGRP